MNKYRPSDAEIAAVVEVLKDWKMPSGWQTAAVLALDAAGKVRAPKKMKKCEDEQMLRFLNGVVGVVIASSEEYHGIWSRNNDRENKRQWEGETSGLFETIGFINERPICISLRIAKIDGHKILFVDATSQLVDWAMVDEWIKLNLPDALKSDATNWYNAIPSS